MAAQGRSSGNRKVQENLNDTEGNIFITPVQIAEIYAGILPKEKAMVEGFLSSLGAITINEKVGRLAGEYMNKYGKSQSHPCRCNGCICLPDKRLRTVDKEQKALPHARFK